MKTMVANFDGIERLAEFLEKATQNAVEDFKKNAPAFRKELENLFSLNISLNIIKASLAQLIMEYAKYPQRALKIVPSILDTVNDLRTTKNNYNRAKYFPRLYPFSLSTLRKQYRDNKDLLDKKIWDLISIALVSTKSEKSIWYSLSSEFANKSSGGGPI